MKLFSFLFGMLAANPMMNMLLMKDLLSDDDSSDGNSNDLMMMMVMSPGMLGGNMDQANQMESLLPLMVMDQSSDDNSLITSTTLPVSSLWSR